MISLQDIKISGPESRSLPFLVTNALITISPPWDVVPDSVVDVLDMIAVSQHLTRSQLAALLTVQEDARSIPEADEYNPDVDRNGTVDVNDLILVSNHFGEVYNDSNAAQQLSLSSRGDSPRTRGSTKAQKAEAYKAYSLINAAPSNSPDIRKLKAHLMRLLSMDSATSFSVRLPAYAGISQSTNLPMSSRLLPNYPNPFNPDTWIPYHLARPSDVTVRIYRTSGQLVRALNLGNKEAGFYTSRDKAVHWDGKNGAGEEVASGIYFYSFAAGDFSAIRKMTVKR